MTRIRMATHVDEGKAEKKVEEHKQHLAAEPALEPVSDLVELEEVVEDEDDQQERETPIKESEIEIKMKEDKEKEKKEIEKEKNQKNKKEKEKVEERKNSKSEYAREKKREINPAEGKDYFLYLPLSNCLDSLPFTN